MKLKSGTVYYIYNPLTDNSKEEIASKKDIVHNKYCFDKLRFFYKERGVRMNEEIKAFLNNEMYVLVYRCNYDRASAVNQQLIDYVKKLQQENKQLKERVNYLERSNNRREDTN